MTSERPKAFFMRTEQMVLPIPELEQQLVREEHLINSLKNVLTLAQERVDELHGGSKDAVFSTSADEIIARESIDRVQLILDRVEGD